MVDYRNVMLALTVGAAGVLSGCAHDLPVVDRAAELQKRGEANTAAQLKSLGVKSPVAQLWVCATDALKSYSAFGPGAYVLNIEKRPDSHDVIRGTAVFDPVAAGLLDKVTAPKKPVGLYSEYNTMGLSVVEFTSNGHISDGPRIVATGHLNSSSAGNKHADFVAQAGELARDFGMYTKGRCEGLLPQ